MIRFWSGTCLVLLFLCGACDTQEAQQQQEVIVPPAAPAVDSTQLKVQALKVQIEQGDSAATSSIALLRQVVVQLQDSIANTDVPPQLQEETIWAYQNRLTEVREVQEALVNWQHRQRLMPSDSASEADKLSYYKQELDDLAALLQQARQARREAREVMQEATLVEQ